MCCNVKKYGNMALRVDRKLCCSLSSTADHLLVHLIFNKIMFQYRNRDRYTIIIATVKGIHMSFFSWKNSGAVRYPRSFQTKLSLLFKFFSSYTEYISFSQFRSRNKLSKCFPLLFLYYFRYFSLQKIFVL